MATGTGWTCGMLLACSCLLVQARPSSAAGEKPSDWPQFRGPGGQGVSSDVGLPVTFGEDEGVVWKVALPGPGTSSPVIVGPRVFITCYSGYNVPGEEGEQADLKLHLLCLNRGDGKELWRRDVKPKLPEQAKIREGHGYASSTPAADSERVYAFFGKSGVHAFDHSGKPLWQADVASELNGWGSAASPVLVGELLIVNASVESESVVALNRKRG